MMFNIWNRYSLENGNRALDIIISPDDRKDEFLKMFAKTLDECGFDGEEIMKCEVSRGNLDLFCYAELLPNREIKFSNGGFCYFGEDNGELYFLTYNSELIPSGYYFTDEEKAEILALFSSIPIDRKWQVTMYA